MSRVLILGGGFGGLAAAHALRATLDPADEIVLVERRSSFVMGLRKAWALVGAGTLEGGERPLDVLARRGIRVVTGEVTTIDPAAKAAVVDSRGIEAEALIVALGAERAAEGTPGFAEYGHNVYDRASIPRAAEAVRDFQGGTIAIGIFGAPYTCPPAPYEMAFLVNDLMRRQGITTQVEVFTPQPMSLPVVGEAGSGLLERKLAEDGIAFHPNHQAVAVEPSEVVFRDGRRRFDLLLGIPPHRCPAAAVGAGLAEAGAWVKVDPATMETRFPGVYAIGDIVEVPTANRMQLPKAGVFAEAQGKVAAAHIAASLAGGASPEVLSGEGYCYMEVGRGMAMEVRGNFLASPAPAVTFGEPSVAMLEEKHAFETARLRDWFGN